VYEIMIVPPHLKRKFDYNEIYVEHIGKIVKDTVSNYCEEMGFASIHRLKKIESLSEKLESGRFEKWSDIDDMFASAIIIPTLNYENEVITFLENTFTTVNIKRRGSTLKAPDVFRFDSTRFIGKLRMREGDRQNPIIYNIFFEIQIRTAFEHAWVVTTHSLTYKNQVIDWKRQRLSSQLKAASEQMDMLAISFDQASQCIPEYEWPEIWVKKDIIDLFNQAIQNGLIRQELLPKDWTRFSDNVYRLIIAAEDAKEMGPLRKAKYVQRCLKTFFDELETLGTQKIPLSISLLQLTFGILSDCGLLKPPLNEYYPLITDELVTFYPSVAIFDKRFNFED
jgi:ppGpp synthetase/RelA/SpoT-type nucleotidyltranferase